MLYAVIGIYFSSLHWKLIPRRILIKTDRFSCDASSIGQFFKRALYTHPQLWFCLYFSFKHQLLTEYHQLNVVVLKYRCSWRNFVFFFLFVTKCEWNSNFTVSYTHSPFTHRLADDGYIKNLYGSFVGFERNVSENRTYANILDSIGCVPQQNHFPNYFLV